jgi:LmbE family N-acetylglucosaminyl deacetylase
VDGRWTSRWFEPSITIGDGTDIGRQFFDRGARGDRYLLLTPDLVRPGALVPLRGTHLRWPSQRGELLLFSNPRPSGAVLVLAPHPDDAEIAAFGLYAAAAAESSVVTITPGNYAGRPYAHIHTDAAGQDALTAHVRTWDSLVVPSWGGVPPERTANLGYLGTSLARLYAERHLGPTDHAAADPRFGLYRRGALERLVPGRHASPTWTSLVDDLSRLLTTVRPAMIVAPHPVLDIADDHQLTTIALLEAMEQTGNDDATLFLYTNHHVLSEYYPFGPADAGVTMPPWFDATLPLSSVYSHPLDEGRQLDKLFALDAMPDLRAAPRRLLGGPTDRFIERLRRSAEDVIRDPVSDYSYYRRAVRPNELFFVYAPAERQALADFWRAGRER